MVQSATVVCVSWVVVALWERVHPLRSYSLVAPVNRNLHFLRFAAHRVPATRKGKIFFRAVTRLKDAHKVALTFDDGPDRGLGDLLELLEKASAHATFFVVGEQVERDPAKLREIVACGHEVALHCYRHRSHLLMTPDQIIEDMRRGREIVEEVAECPIRRYRPPYGCFSMPTWFEAGRQGWQRVLWTHDSRDWDPQSTPQSIVDNLESLRAGDIILMHDSDRYSIAGSWDKTRIALPTILGRISYLGLKVCSLSEILYDKEC